MLTFCACDCVVSETIVEDDAGHMNSLLVVEESDEKVDLEMDGMLYSCSHAFLSM